MLKAHRTVPFVDGLKIVPAHPQREWMNATPLPPNKDGSVTKGTGFANRCLPLLMANQLGWDVVTKFGYVITALDNGTHITYHPKGGRGPRYGAPQNNFLNSLVTWPLPWNFETPEGWDLLLMPPANRFLPRGVTCLTGLIETDHTPATFTMNWRMEPGTAITIEEGDVLATLVPYPTAQIEGWDFVEDEDTPEAYPHWVERRRESTDRMNENFGRWDKDYWNEAKRKKIKKGDHVVDENSGQGINPMGLPSGGCPVNHG